MRPSLSLLAFFSLAACFGDDPDGGDTGAPEPAGGMPYCEETASVAISGDDDALGRTADAFVAALPAEAAASAEWADGSLSGLTLSVVVDEESLRLVSQEVVYPDTDGPVPSIAVDCPTYVAVDASVVISTEDGRLSEALPVSFQREEYMDSEAVALARFALDPDGLSGSLDLADFADTAAYDETSLDMDIIVQEAAVAGTLSGIGTAEDGDVAFAEFIEVMSFSGSLE